MVRTALSPEALAHTSTGMKNRPQHHMSVTQDLLGCKAECLAGKVSKKPSMTRKNLFCPYRQHQLSMIKMHMKGLCVSYFKITCFIFHSRDFFGGYEGEKIEVLYGLRRHAESNVE